VKADQVANAMKIADNDYMNVRLSTGIMRGVAMLLACTTMVRGEDNTLTVVDGVVSNNTDSGFYIGNTGTNNVLRIINGGELNVANSAYVGATASASNNTAFVDGPGSSWHSTGNITLGRNGGDYNNVVVTNGAQLTSGNALSVGSGSSIQSTESMHNRLQVYAGSTVSNAVMIIGQWENALYNSAELVGPGTECYSGALYVGDEGSFNTLAATDGVQLEADRLWIGVHADASDNTLSLSGTNTQAIVDDDIWMGREGARNTLDLRDGVSFIQKDSSYGSGRDLIIGQDATADDNIVRLSGPGTLFDNSGTVTLGRYGSGNRLVVSNAASLSSGSLEVGWEEEARHNRVELVGVGTEVSLSSPFDSFVGGQGSSNTLMVSDGAYIASDDGFSIGKYEGSRGNAIIADGQGSKIEAVGNSDLIVGGSGEDGLLEVRDRALLTCGGLKIGDAGDGNRAMIDGELRPSTVAVPFRHGCTDQSAALNDLSHFRQLFNLPGQSFIFKFKPADEISCFSQLLGGLRVRLRQRPGDRLRGRGHHPRQSQTRRKQSVLHRGEIDRHRFQPPSRQLAGDE